MKYKNLFNSFNFFLSSINISYGQDNNIINKTKSQLKLTESNQMFYQGNIKTALLNYKKLLHQILLTLKHNLEQQDVILG